MISHQILAKNLNLLFFCRTSPDYEYTVYLRPRGKLATLLQQFSEKSKTIKENTAHQYLPHCTLTGFFRIPQSIELKSLTSILRESVADVQNRLAEIISVTGIFSNDSFIGLSFNDEKILEELKPKIELFADKMKQHGAHVRVKPEPTSHYHISLAYGMKFDQNTKQQLMNLVDAVNVKSAFTEAEWVIEIYCRKSKYQTAEEWMNESIEDQLLFRK